MTNSPIFSAAIIGLGNIGQGYDYDCRDGSRILTHASGFEKHANFRLVGGVDPDAEARRRFEQRFRQKAYGSIGEMLSVARPEIVSIGVPTALHADVFNQIMDHSPRAILCEKPIAASVDQARKMVVRAREQGCALLVNYMRRFDPAMGMLRDAIAQGDFGPVVKGVVWYSKGLLNNGSHYIDLLSYLIGEVDDTRVLNDGRLLSSGDREPDVCVSFGGVPVYFLAGKEENFSLKEITLVCAQAVIRYVNGGEKILIQKTEPSRLFPSYRNLASEGEEIRGGLDKYQFHVVDALYRHLATGSPLASNGETALETLMVVERIMAQASKSGVT